MKLYSQSIKDEFIIIGLTWIYIWQVLLFAFTLKRRYRSIASRTYYKIGSIALKPLVNKAIEQLIDYEE